MGIYLVSSEWRAIEGWYGQWMLWTVNGHGSILGLFMGYPCAHWNNIMGNFYELKQGVIPWSCSEGQPWSITGWLLPLAIVCLVMLVVARPSWFRRTYATCPVGETVKPEFVASKHHPLDIKCDVVVDVSLNLNKSIHKGNQIQHTHTHKKIFLTSFGVLFFVPLKSSRFFFFSIFCFSYVVFWMDPQPKRLQQRCIETREDQLSSQDLIDLIGAAGHLGGKLHMMTRALADQLEPRSSEVVGDRECI